MNNSEALDIATYYEQLPDVENTLVMQNSDGTYSVLVVYKDGTSTMIGG
jgi:hypothetical protein